MASPYSVSYSMALCNPNAMTGVPNTIVPSTRSGRSGGRRSAYSTAMAW